jgi:hypothetical protein
LQHTGSTGNFYLLNQENGAIQFGTNNTERMRLDSTGRLGLGTSSPNELLEVTGNIHMSGAANRTIFNRANNALSLGTNNTARLHITNAGNVGIGTTSPGSTLTVNGSARVQNTGSFAGINVRNNNDSSVVTTTSFFDASNNLGTIDGHLFFEHLPSGGCSAVIATTPAGDRAIDRRATRVIVGFNGTTTLNSAASTAPFIAQINSAEAARIDSSGRLLVGTSTAYTVEGFNRHSYFCPTGGDSNNNIVVSATGTAGFPAIYFTKTRGASPTTQTIVQNNDALGRIRFFGSDGVDYDNAAAAIDCLVDGTPGANDMPGRLVFLTTADGASIPTERLRITNAGVLQVADAGNIAVGTTTGTKIGTATTQKLGFYNATPVVQPAAVADATDAATAISQLNALLAHMRTLGLIAT